MERAKNSKGFTLIELLIVIVIMGILGVGVLSLQYILGQNQTLVLKNYLSVDEANKGVSQFSKEIRIIKSADNGAYPLANAGDFEIVFYSDIDFDSDTEKVRYYLDGTNLTKGVIEPVGHPATYPSASENIRVISENIRNADTPVFYYYNADWPQDALNNPLAAEDRLSDTRTIRIYLRLNTKAGESEKDYVLESYIQPRMLKDNL